MYHEWWCGGSDVAFTCDIYYTLWESREGRGSVTATGMGESCQNIKYELWRTYGTRMHEMHEVYQTRRFSNARFSTSNACYNTLQHTTPHATRYNKLHHTTTLCDTLPRAASRYTILHHVAVLSYQKTAIFPETREGNIYNSNESARGSSLCEANV